MFDLDYLTNSMNYEHVSVENQANKSTSLEKANNIAGIQANDDQGANSEEIDLNEEHFVLPIWSAYSTTVKCLGDNIEKNTSFKTCENPVSQVEQAFLEELEKLKRQEKEANDAAESLRKEATHDIQNASTSSTNLLNTAGTPLNTAGPSRAFNDGELSYPDSSKYALPDDPSMPHLEDIYASPGEGIFTNSSYDDEGVTRSKMNKNSEAHALVWILVDLPFKKKAIETKWVYRNKKDEMGVVVRNKARLVTQGYRQEEGIDYDEVFAPVARIEAIRTILAFASYIGFIIYQMDMKSAFLYGTIDEEVYVSQPPGFVYPKFPNKVYNVVKDLYGLHQALRACVKTASTPIETQKPLVKDEEADDVDVSGYSKTSHLQAVKRIFRYLKGQSKLGLWYLKVSSFDLEAYSDTDYAGANLDKKSTTGGCQFLGRRLISWQCKKQTIVATSTTEAEYVATAHCYGQVLDAYEKKLIQVLKIHTDDNVANLLTKAFDVSSKELASPKQVALGKDISNPLMAGKLHCQLVPKQPLGMNLASIWHQKSFVLLQIKRFVQLLIDHQLGDMSHHKDIYDNPSLTKKVFANIKRVGTGFSEVVTRLFDNMLVPVAKEVGLIQDDVPSLEPSPEHKLPSPSNDLLPGGKDSMKLKELIDLCTHLSNQVLELENEVIDIKSTSKERTKKLEGRVDRLDEENRVLKKLYIVHSKVNTATPVVKKEKSFKQDRIIAYINEDDVDEKESADVEKGLEVVKAAKLMTKLVTTTGATTTAEATKVSVPRRRRGVVIQDHEKTTSTVVVHSKVQSKDKGKVMKYQALKRKHLTEAQARKNMIIYLKNMAGFKMNYFKGMTYNEIRPLFEKHYHYNQAFLEEVNEEVTVPEKKVEVEAHKREGKSLEKEITKKQKMDEEVEELRSHLHIVSNDDDDVYTKATPLASKIPNIDYKIHFKRNKPYFKIIRVDGNHMLFLSFSTLLKNFDREDLKSLWKLVKERFEKTQPKNYTNDYLLKTLKIMFELMLKLVYREIKRRYPLTHFTLEQMLNNVRLEVEEESEMFLELLRFIFILMETLTIAVYAKGTREVILLLKQRFKGVAKQGKAKKKARVKQKVPFRQRECGKCGQVAEGVNESEKDNDVDENDDVEEDDELDKNDANDDYDEDEDDA
uniref:Copia protein n=1 Tax=Tanacetum cinerariifolium TaxID=118510 RepID=A0A699GYL2_TANCI|nr:copia protein [Tanacetum cinerariifolium]